GTATSAAAVSVLRRVTGFTPSAAPVGATVTISGNAFGGATSVLFNGVVAIPATVTATKITVVEPADASTGKLTVVTGAGPGQSDQPDELPRGADDHRLRARQRGRCEHGGRRRDGLRRRDLGEGERRRRGFRGAVEAAAAAERAGGRQLGRDLGHHARRHGDQRRDAVRAPARDRVHTLVGGDRLDGDDLR